MKKEEIQKLSEVIKRLVQKEVAAAVEDMSVAMATIIKETIESKLTVQQSILQERDLVGEKRKNMSNIRDDFSNKLNYGYTLSQLANSTEPDTERYTPKVSKSPIVTKNKVLNSIFSQVAEEMPSNFGNPNYGLGNPLMENNNLNFNMPTPTTPTTPMTDYDGHMNTYNQPPMVQSQQPIRPTFDLPTLDADNKPINLNSVPPTVVGALVRDYRSVLKLAEEKTKYRHNK